MEKELDSEMQVLLQKYAGGRMPPLVDVKNPELGLINGELLRVYHRGIWSIHSLSLGILLAAGDHISAEDKWRKGDFSLNEWAKPWSPFCETLRATQAGNMACENCDRRFAAIAEKKNDVIAYLCDNGMIDFAVPISVKDQVIAILFCGQLKPKAGSIWNPEFVQHDGLFRPITATDACVDAWAESQQRIRRVEQQIGLTEGELLRSLSDSNHSTVEVTPQQVEEIQSVLRKSAAQLSDLATSTYELEKGRIVDWIRNCITHSLAPFSPATAETVEVWKRLSFSLNYMIRYLRLDYALIFYCPNKAEEGFEVLCHASPPEINLQMGERVSSNAPSLSTLKSRLRGLKEPSPIVLRGYKDLPLFDRLHRLHMRGKSKQALMVPILTPLNSGSLVMVLGEFKRDVKLDAFSSDDREALARMIEGITLVTEIILLVEQLKETARKQARFLEDVAHDIRTPIQNIIVEAEVLTQGVLPVEDMQRLAQRLVAQVRRLHLISQRVWTLVSIDLGVFKPDETELVNVFQTLMECRKSLIETAAKRDIQIVVDRELDGWRAIRVNRTLYVQTVLNLIDNAIKYSRAGTEVRIDGKRLPTGVTLSFVNRGIPIREEDKGAIFERYYRSKEARTFRQEGTGIGLSIVKAFADHYGSIEVKSTPIPGTRDHVNEFKLFIREKGVE